MLTIGNVKLPHAVMLAPMAGISSLPFRLLNRQYGCEYACTEMVDVRSLSYGNTRTMRILATVPEDRPLGVQLLGKDREYIKKALDKLTNCPFDVLDFNAACPQKKIAHNGKGAGLLKNPRLLHDIVKEIAGAVAIPVTVKMRLGWDSSEHAGDIAKHIEDAGAKAIIVHGRTKVQGYSGTVDHKGIAKVKKAVRIPVIGSGDIFSAHAAKKMREETGCDGIAVARGALGNPWIFKEIHEFMRGGKIITHTPTVAESAALMWEHFEADCAFYGEEVGVIDFRKFFIWYTKGYPKVRSLRTRLSGIKTKKDMRALVDEFKKKGRGVKYVYVHPYEGKNKYNPDPD